MSKVFVIDTEKLPLTPVHPGRARLLLTAGKAAVTITTKHGKVTDVPHRYCRPLHRADGYAYHQGARISTPPTSPKGAPVSAPA